MFWSVVSLCNFLHYIEKSTLAAPGSPGYDRLDKVRPLLDYLLDYLQRSSPRCTLHSGPEFSRWWGYHKVSRIHAKKASQKRVWCCLTVYVWNRGTDASQQLLGGVDKACADMMYHYTKNDCNTMITRLNIYALNLSHLSDACIVWKVTVDLLKGSTTMQCGKTVLSKMDTVNRVLDKLLHF